MTQSIAKIIKLSTGHSCSIIKLLNMMKNYLKNILARKNNTLVKNSFMVSKSCVIEKTGKKFHNTAFVCFSSPRKCKSILRGFCNAVALPGDASYASLLTNRLSQATVGCLMLAYSFSPRVHSIPRGPRFPLAMTLSTSYGIKYTL